MTKIGYRGGSEPYVKVGDRNIAITSEIGIWLSEEMIDRYTVDAGVVIFNNKDDEIIFMLKFGNERPPISNEDGGYFYCPYIPEDIEDSNK